MTPYIRGKGFYKDVTDRRDGVMVRASALQSVDLGFVFQLGHAKRLQKMVFTAFLLGAQHNRDSVENKPASLLVVSLGKTLNGMPPSLCGRQAVGPSSLPVVVAQSNRRLANRAWALTQCMYILLHNTQKK